MRTPTPPELESIARRHGLKLMVLFGSQASGHTHPASDLDVAILPTHPLSWDERNVLWGELCELFQTEVDLSLLDHAQPLLMAKVTRHGQVLYEGEQSAWASLSFTPGVCIGARLPLRKAQSRYLDRRAEEMRDAG
jgi:predicted nucleotidyltransferase